MNTTKKTKTSSIKRKLLTKFLIVAFVSLIVGLLGTVGMLTLSANEKTLYNEGVGSLTGVNGMYAVIVEQRLEIRGMFFDIDDIDAINECVDKMHAREQEFEELYDLYLSYSSGTDKKENELVQKARGIYDGEFKTLKEQIVAALQAGDHAAAREANTKIGPVAEEATEALYQMVLYGEERAASISEQDSSTAITLIAISAVLTVTLVVLAVVMGLYNARAIATPLSSMAEAARSLSVGDVDVNLAVKSNDEIGILANAFEKMIVGIREQADLLESLAQGDYTVSVPIRSDKDVINQAIQDLVTSGGQMMTEVQTASDQVTIASAQISQSAQGLASGSSEQAASVEELSASITHVKDQVDENSRRSQKVLENCEVTGNLMEESLLSMNQMQEAMSAIDESSRNITRVVKAISDIAFQTNLLALNASIEATQAGQHGKGFAVVAEEVRNLANKSAEAAQETAALIENSVQNVSEGNRIVEKAGESLRAVGVAASENAEIIGEMSSSLDGQVKAVSEINLGIGQVSTVIQANAATAEESAAASEELSAQAVVLNEIVSRFKLNTNEPVLKSRRTVLLPELDSDLNGLTILGRGGKY